MNLLEHRRGRILLFTVLYLSEGAPIGFVWFALPTLLRQEGMSLERITALTSMLVVPWVAKFLWAPLVDTWRTPRFGFRGWIICSQLLMGLTLVPLIGKSPVDHFTLWQVLLFGHAMAAATQDVSVDALAIRCVEVHERGGIHGCMQAGMLLGRSLLAGGALWTWNRWGQGATLLCLMGVTWISLLLLLGVKEPAMTRETSRSGAWKTFRLHLVSAFRHRTMWIGLLFALTGAAAFELTGALAGPFLSDHGASVDAIGTFFALGMVGATLIGGLVGGPLSDRIGRVRAVAIFLIGFVAIVGLLAAVSRTSYSSDVGVLFFLLTIMYVFVGLFTASSYALFMDLTDPKLGATQFSTFMAATNGCESWSVRVGGFIVQRSEYAMGFAVMCLVSLGSLLFLRKLNVQDPDPAGHRKGRASRSPRAAHG